MYVGLPSGCRCRTRRKDAISFGHATVFVVGNGVRGDKSARVVRAGQVGSATFAACGKQARPRRVLLTNEPQDSTHAGGVDHCERPSSDDRPEKISRGTVGAWVTTVERAHSRSIGTRSHARLLNGALLFRGS